MCGIVADHGRGAGGSDGVALARLRHRGPDGSGRRQVGPTMLGHARLSIVDLDGGGQPLVDPASGRAVVCNGEIYNHLALRDRLPDRAWATASDSEAVLGVVDAWGPGGVAQLRGMYAFVVADPDPGAFGGILAARDPIGIKPLYWAERDGRVLFASELRAFDPSWRPAVRTFPPGHRWTPHEGLVRFADAPAAGEPFATRGEAAAAVREQLAVAVRRRLMADVDVGVFLSGGLDSSIVAALAARETGPGLRSFAVGTPGSPDLAAARVVADHLGLDHHELVHSPEDLVAALGDTIRSIESYEPSLVRSAVPNALLARLASRHVKVVLTGEGADELFAGYDHHRDIDVDELQAELVRSVAGLHDLNLQRCDRVTMAQGLEARVPFLDLDVIAVAGRIPIAWRLPGAPGEEKRLLRETFDGWLPDEVLWRRKEEFGTGSGAKAVLPAHAEAVLAGEDWRTARVDGLPPPRSAEELLYQRHFVEHLGGVRVDEVLGRFATA